MPKLEQRVRKLEERVSKLEKLTHHVGVSKTRRVNNLSKLDNFGSKLQGKMDSIGPQNLVVIALRLKPKQTKPEMENLFVRWGIKQTIHGWFKGGNFNKRLLETGIVMKDGKDQDGQELFSLTVVKGIQTAKMLFEKYKL